MSLGAMSDPQSLVLVPFGGTGLTVYAVGDLIYASGTATLSRLAVGSNTHVLTLVAGVPTWAAPFTSRSSTLKTSSTAGV